MSAVLERLRTLRSERGAEARRPESPSAPRPLPEPASAPRALPAEYLETRATLARLLGLRTARMSPAVPRMARPAVRAHAPLPGCELAPGVRLVESEWLAAGTDAAVDEDTRDTLRFLDTETTGLAGGTGTLAFVLALAQWQGPRLRVRQLLLTRPGGEADMLRAFREWIAPTDVLVSYNGRCFDAPLLATRFRMNGMPDPLAGLAHRDLLHAVRRRYRRTWSDCRLLTAERELLGIERHDDLPGAEAPMAWRRFLATGDAEPVTRVLRHNHQDLVSLARLADRLGDEARPPPVL